MAETDVSILDFTTASVLTPSDLLYFGVVDTGVTEGYNDAKAPLSLLASSMLNSFEYTQDLTTSAKTIIGAINELKSDIPADIENVVFPVVQGGNE